jgi:UDP-N-acetylmuramoyl-L-alanyl-D-glutamate--2,6-diaminopimelate ligase
MTDHLPTQPMKPQLTLRSCIERLRETGLLLALEGNPDARIDRLTADSRDVGPSSAFVAIRGTSTDGHLFIDKAVSNGATAIVCEAGPAGDLGSPHAAPAPAREQSWLVVSDSRRAFLELVSLVQGDPGADLHITAVTGTNGKTSIATLVHGIWHLQDDPCGLIGTTGIMDGRTFHPATHTTPSPDQLMGWMARMLQNGCSHVAMEASSHALDQARLRPEDTDVAVFTNLTRDHLDYHGSYDAYFQAKKRLFDALSKEAVAITNTDDPRGKAIVADTRAAIVTIGQQDADIRYTIAEESLSGLRLTLDGDTRTYRLAGAYNGYNLAAAYAAVRAGGLSRAEALDRLSEQGPVRGRFELIHAEDGRTVIVDYAHTPDALENVLRTTRTSLDAAGRLFCLFGCGGDRDRGKRPQMGRLAEALADRVVVTSDNPRSEDPEAILHDIRAGFAHPANATWIVDRRSAIRHAVDGLRPGDVLVVAGKGHETTQVMAGTTLHFDDREEARLALGLASRDTHTG